MDLAMFFNLPPADAAALKAGGYGARAGEVISGNLARGGDGKFAAAGNASAAKKPAAVKPGTKPKPSQRRAAKPKKPKKPPADRAAEASKKQQANRANVVKAMADSDTGLQPAAFAALTDFADGKPADPAMLKTLAGTGLLEQAGDGSFRLSPQGRTFVAAADAGDTRRALDAMSKAGDLRTNRAAAADKRTAREGAAADRKRDVAARRAAAAKRGDKKPAADKPEKPGKPSKGGGGGSGKKPPKVPPPQTDDALPDARRKIAQCLSDGDALSEAETADLIRNGLAKYDKKDALILTAAGQRAIRPPKQKSFAVYKDAAGRYRWLAVSSTAFRDRDKEIVSTKALTEDVARTDALPDAGPLRFWHVAGMDIGDCDYAAVSGRSLIESGTFRDERYGQALKDSPLEWHISLGFFHLANEPDAQGVFHSIRRFERSIVPAGRASNPFTRLVVKEVQMVPEKEAALKALMAREPELIDKLLASVAQTEKDADAAGTAYKAAGDLPPEIEAEVKAPEGMMPDEEVEIEGDEPTGEYVGDMTPEAFTALLGNALAAALAPLLEAVNVEAKMSGVLGELKDMVGGYAKQKDASEAEARAQIAALQTQIEASTAEQAKLKESLAELLGDQPTARGYRASQAADTVITDDHRLKASAPAVTDFVSFLGIGAGQ